MAVEGPTGYIQRRYGNHLDKNELNTAKKLRKFCSGIGGVWCLHQYKQNIVKSAGNIPIRISWHAILGTVYQRVNSTITDYLAVFSIMADNVERNKFWAPGCMIIMQTFFSGVFQVTFYCIWLSWPLESCMFSVAIVFLTTLWQAIPVYNKAASHV